MTRRHHRPTGTATALRPPTRRRRLAAVALAGLVAAGCSSTDTTADPAEAPPVTAGAAAAELTAATVDASFGVLDDIVDEVMAATGVPGVAVAVVYDDATVYERGYGVRRTGADDPVTPDTVFQLASLSKPISATVMAGLVGDGVFDWDDPIAGYTDDFALSDAWVTDNVTFADLFAHRSGLPGGSAGNDLEGIGYGRDVILERLAYVPLDGFRSNYSYSNFGMTLGGEAAARAAGTTWEQAADDVLFGPAAMASTSASHADFTGRDNRASLHVPTDEGWQPNFERQPDAQSPAGGVSSSVTDLARWMRLSMAGGELDGQQVIATEPLDATHTPHMVRRPPAPTIADPASFYGLGWGIDTDGTGTVRWSHSGAFSTGASTVVNLVPAESLGIVVLTNAAPIGAPEAIAEAYLDYLLAGDTDVAGTLDVWQQRMAGLYGEPAVDVDNPPANPLGPRADAAYVGTYANDYVGDIEVRATGSGLEMVVGDGVAVFALEHWDGDAFLYFDAPELPGFPGVATFEVADGSAVSVNLSSLDAAGLGTLDRT